MALPYCTEGDLLVDMEISSSLSKESFVRDAADEMNARLGFVYALPLTGLPNHAVLLLKHINARLASGRMLMMIAAASEDVSVHAYGEFLIKEAYSDLYAICNGSILLVGAVAIADPNSNAPSIYNQDEESAFEQYENHMMRGVPSWWVPGAVN